MNELSATALYRKAKGIEKKAIIPIILTFIGFPNMFVQVHHLQMPWRYLLLLSWIFPMIVTFYIHGVSSRMKNEALENWGSDDEGTEI